MDKSKPRIGITIGDPAGIGPEVVCMCLAQKELYEECVPVVIGNGEVLKRALQSRGLSMPVRCIKKTEDAVGEYGIIDLIDLPLRYEYIPGVLQAGNGEFAIRCIHEAVKLIRGGELDATCTAPTNKEAMRMAGSPFMGATELFAHLGGAKKASTVILQGGCYVFQVTTHVPLRKAIEMITTGTLYEFISKADLTLKSFGFKSARIGLAGFNPHAGDGGLLGGEEQEIFMPAVKRLREEGVCISDPLPADTIYERGQKGEFDALILLFHDSSNIAIKLISKDVPAAVITAGLPFVRTTVAHGTAYDIAYKGIADYKQFYKAITAAADICRRRFGEGA